MLTVVAFVVIVFLILLALFVITDLAVLPGKIARARSHPQADAVRVAGIVGLLSGIFWPFALVWAYYRPSVGTHIEPHASQENAELKARIAELEAQLAPGTAGEGGKPT
ncbi:MAG: DUF3302 domain-containing protein [Hyphomicrobiales bacterium]